MKKLLLFLAITCLVSAGCKKSKPDSDHLTATGFLYYGGDPAVDGIGYVIRVTDLEILVPENLPDNYKQPSISKRVKIVFEYTGRMYRPIFISSAGLPIIRLHSITDL